MSLYWALTPGETVLGSLFPRWLNGKEFPCQCRRCRFNPWIRKIPWRRKWQSTLVFLHGESLGQRSLAGRSPRGHRVRHHLPTEHTHTLPLKVCILWPLQPNYTCCIASAAAHYHCLPFCTWVQWKQFGFPESASIAGSGITNLSNTCRIQTLCASCACTFHLYLGTFSIIQPWHSITLKFLIWNIVTYKMSLPSWQRFTK